MRPLTRSSRSFCPAMLLTFTSVRLQNWKWVAAQSHSTGWFPSPYRWTGRCQARQALDASTRFHKSKKNSFVTLCRKSTAELLARPRCELVSHQLPDLQAIISLSSAEKRDESSTAECLQPKQRRQYGKRCHALQWPTVFHHHSSQLKHLPL